MNQGYTREARLEDVAIIAADLRDADLAELKAASGLNPLVSLPTGIKHGVSRVACLASGTPVAIFGVVPASQGVGAVWMVATNQFKTLHRQFLRECRGELEKLSAGYRLLYNYTDARNHVHHRWIKWVGFTFIKKHECAGVEGRPFLEFVRITEASHV